MTLSKVLSNSLSPVSPADVDAEKAGLYDLAFLILTENYRFLPPSLFNGALPPKAVENLSLIHTSGHRLASMVNDLPGVTDVLFHRNRQIMCRLFPGSGRSFHGY